MSVSDNPAAIDLIAFPGAPNLPIFAAREKGFFEEAGVAVDITTTPSSAYQAENLVNGRFRIAATAFDNVVAYREGRGAVALEGGADLFAFMGATQIELALVAAPGIVRVAELAGRSLALDAVATGFAFVLYEMLARAGVARDAVELVPVGATPQRWESVKNGAHAATLTIEPFTSIAKALGFNVLATSTDLFECYQGGVFAASRTWAANNTRAILGFIRGYLAGLAWTLAPGNRAEAAELLLRNLPAIKPPVVDAVLDSLLSPRSGLTPKGAILADGVRTVLDLRTRYGAGGPVADPGRYVDLRYYEQATRA